MTSKNTELAILFADISGSTRLYEMLGDAAARKKVADCLAILTEVTKRYNGTVIKTIGDEVMCTFPKAEEAATAACEMHEILEDEITEQTEHGAISLSIRVGMHFGPAILEAGDVFGDAVNVAARMAALAKAGEIITTQSAVDQMSPILRANTRFIDRASIKGKKGTLDIYEVIWQQEDVTRMSTGVIPDHRPATARLNLRYKNTKTVVDDEHAQVIMGRSTTVGITVMESLASRQHVRLEHRRGKFFIIDQSTNGTYVKNGNNVSFLRREEMPLGGSGTISLGRSYKDDPQELVHYSIEE